MGSSGDPSAHAAGRGAWRAVLTQSLDVQGAAEILGVPAAMIHQMVCSGELVAVRVGGVWRLPAWQFGAHGLLPGVAALLDSWSGSFVSLSMWACTPSGQLRGRTPAEALNDSDVLDVTAALPALMRSRESMPPQ
jgi:excisionase family DNA binding protein